MGAGEGGTGVWEVEGEISGRLYEVEDVREDTGRSDVLSDEGTRGSGDTVGAFWGTLSVPGSDGVACKLVSPLVWEKVFCSS